MSVELKSIFMKKQIYYVFVYMFMWTCFLLNAFYMVFSSWKNGGIFTEAQQNISNNLQTLSMTSALCTGFVLSFMRTREPYFNFLITQEMKQWFGYEMDEK